MKAWNKVLLASMVGLLLVGCDDAKVDSHLDGVRLENRKYPTLRLFFVQLTIH